MCQSLTREHPTVRIQSHINENPEEIAHVCAAFPWASDYLHVYERYALVGPRQRYWRTTSIRPARSSNGSPRAETSIAHCPCKQRSPWQRHLSVPSPHGSRCARLSRHRRGRWDRLRHGEGSAVCLPDAARDFRRSSVGPTPDALSGDVGWCRGIGAGAGDWKFVSRQGRGLRIRASALGQRACRRSRRVHRMWTRCSAPSSRWPAPKASVTCAWTARRCTSHDARRAERSRPFRLHRRHRLDLRRVALGGGTRLAAAPVPFHRRSSRGDDGHRPCRNGRGTAGAAARASRSRCACTNERRIRGRAARGRPRSVDARRVRTPAAPQYGIPHTLRLSLFCLRSRAAPRTMCWTRWSVGAGRRGRPSCRRRCSRCSGLRSSGSMI